MHSEVSWPRSHAQPLSFPPHMYSTVPIPICGLSIVIPLITGIFHCCTILTPLQTRVYSTPHYPTLPHTTPHYPTLPHTTPHYPAFTLSHITPHPPLDHPIPPHTTSHHLTPPHTTSHHLTQPHTPQTPHTLV